jgi:hypothetical protein
LHENSPVSAKDGHPNTISFYLQGAAPEEPAE